jgi:phosphatidylglycerophosphate synthase
MGSEKSPAVIAFASPAEADRRVAGVAAAARTVHEKAAEGAVRIRLGVGGGRPSAGTLADIERLRGAAAVEIVADGEGAPGRYPLSSWEIVKRTGKPGDGIVSRWLNRPVSQRITWLLLHLPGARPVHVTVFSAVLALAIVPVLLLGGEAGLILGGILFHTASVLDGVDGEMARASFRASPAGAALDSAVDAATTLLFIAGLTFALALRDGGAIGWIGGWVLIVAVVGWSLIARRVRAAGAPLGFDLFKRSGGVRSVSGLVFRVVQTLSGRDCYAFLFMVLIVAGLERTALIIFTSVATLWFVYVLASLAPWPRALRGAA